MPQSNDLNQVEADFIEFLAGKLGKDFEYLKNIYLKTKKKFNFGGDSFKKYLLESYELSKILYDDDNEKEACRSYKFHALTSLFRFLGSSDAPDKNISYYMRVLARAIARGNYNKIGRFLKKRLFASGKKSPEGEEPARTSEEEIARFLLENAGKKPVVVDYGCGLGQIPFEMAKQNKETRVYLADIDSLVFDFVKFRFKKYGIKAKFIPVTEDDLYPELPDCNIVIATEVMEHVHQPLKVFKNIREGLQKGGVLYGDFDDHDSYMFHVSPKLEELRSEVGKYFDKIGPFAYRKK